METLTSWRLQSIAETVRGSIVVMARPLPGRAYSKEMPASFAVLHTLPVGWLPNCHSSTPSDTAVEVPETLVDTYAEAFHLVGFLEAPFWVLKTVQLHSLSNRTLHCCT